MNKPVVKYVLIFVLGLAIGILGAMGFCWSSGPLGKVASMDEELGQVSYAYGYQIGENLKNQSIPLEVKTLSRAIQDGMTGTKSLMSKKEMADVRIKAYNKKMSSKR